MSKSLHLPCVVLIMIFLALFPATPVFAQEIALKVVDVSKKGEVYVQVENTGSYGLYLASPDDIDYSKNYFFEAINSEGKSEVIQRRGRKAEGIWRIKRIHLMPGELRVFKFELLDGSWDIPNKANSLSNFGSLRVHYRQEMDLYWASVDLFDTFPAPFISFGFIGKCSSLWHLKGQGNHHCTFNQKAEDRNGTFFVFGLRMAENDVQELNRLLGNKWNKRTPDSTPSVSTRNEAVYYVSEPDRWMEWNVCFRFELDDTRKMVNSDACGTLPYADNTSVYGILAKYRRLAGSIKEGRRKQSSDWMEKQDFSAHSQPPPNKEEIEKIIDQSWDMPITDDYEERK